MSCDGLRQVVFQAGRIVVVVKSHRGRVARWLLWAAVTGLLGGACVASSERVAGFPSTRTSGKSFVIHTLRIPPYGGYVYGYLLFYSTGLNKIHRWIVESSNKRKHHRIAR